MGGVTNFPSVLDDDTSLFDAVDNTTALIASHHNNLKEAVKAVEAKVGIIHTTVPTSLDFRLGSATAGHGHNAASGQGPKINPTAIMVPSGGYPDGLSLYEHMMARPRYIYRWDYQGSAPSGASLGAPFALPRTVQVESIMVTMRRAPSGATAAFDVNVGATSLWQASNGLRPVFPAGTIGPYGHASPNLVTIPSGALVVIDADKVGTNEPSSDISFTFVFKD